MMNPENKRPVVLEDLLRLKRAERPSAEFWAQFDHELRAKQLAALVEKRPWWSALPRALAGISRYHLPLGATAVLALTIVSVREFHSKAPVRAVALETTSVAVATVPASSETSPAALPMGGAAMPISSVAAVDERGTDARFDTLALNEAPTVAADSIDAASAETSAADNSPAGRQTVLSVRSLEGALLALRGAEATFARDVLDVPHGSEVRLVASNKHRVDPLAQMTPPTEARRSSLFNASFARSYEPAVRSATSRAVSRLSDDQLYDTASRFIAKGNSLGAKF